MAEDSQVVFDKVKQALVSLGPALQGAEAIGLFGSLARGKGFTERSDIDVFIVVKQKDEGTDEYGYAKISDALADLRRDVTVLVYSVKSLREVASWYVLRLASEGIVLFDRGGIRELFEKIVKAALLAGLLERETEAGRKVWTIPKVKLGKEVEVKVDD